MRYWISIMIFFIIVLWVSLIFYFSTRFPAESARQTNLVYSLLKKLDKALDFSETQFFIKMRTAFNRLWFGDRRVTAFEFIRKSAHFGLYFSLGSLCFLFGLFYTQKIFAAILLGLSFPSLIASFDEYSQQYFHRGASLNDVIIDISGAAFGVIFTLVLTLIVRAITKLTTCKRARHDRYLY